MADIELTVHTADGRKHVVEVPVEMKASEFLQELEAGLHLATVDGEGNPIEWLAHNKDLGRALDREKSLEENSVRPGSHLQLYGRSVHAEASPLLRAEASTTASISEEVTSDWKQRVDPEKFKPQPPTPPGEFFACPKCSVLIAADVKFCPKCGYRFGSGRRFDLMAAAIPGAALLVLSAALWLWISHRAPTPSTTAMPAHSPKIASITPNRGPVAGRATIIIHGSGFTGAKQVTFGGQAARFEVQADDRITANLPPFPSPSDVPAEGLSLDVSVCTLAGCSPPATPGNFTYLPQPAQPAPPPSALPVIASIRPTSGPASGGISVLIEGSGFVGVTQVTFGGASARFDVQSTSQIAAILPPAPARLGPAGAYQAELTICTSSGCQPAQAKFTYLAPRPPLPRITGISPKSSPATTGVTATIDGSGFTGARQVTLGSNPLRFDVQSDTRISAIIPPLSDASEVPSSGSTVGVTICTSGGCTGQAPQATFTYLPPPPPPPPAITSIDPPSGPAAGGTTITIEGSGFKDAKQVTFGGVPARFEVSGNRIAAVQPAFPKSSQIGANGAAVDISVCTPSGCSPQSAAGRFVYVPPVQKQKQIYTGPREGAVVWSGEVAKNQTFWIDGPTTSLGTVTGELPGVPVQIDYANPVFAVVEAPSAQNGWKRLVLRSSKHTHVVLVLHWQVL